MSTTIKVNEVVIDALEDLVVQAEEQEIVQAEARAAIRALNDMMLAWEARGIDLGYTIVENMGDEMTVPYGSLQGIKAYLAIALAPKYDATVTQALIQKAKDGWDAIVDLAVDIGSMAFPDTLPQGHGNDYPGYADRTFYPDVEGTILTETGGSIALEEDTEEG